MPNPPVHPQGGTWDSRRDALAQWVDQCPELPPLGYTPGNVFQADTAESPSVKPFIVIRWGDQIESMGLSGVWPVTLWVYDEFGDFNRATKMARDLGAYLADNVVDFRTTSGRISQINNLGTGGDLADDGFDALVIPQNLRLIGRGD